jgi:hypothetical protein
VIAVGGGDPVIRARYHVCRASATPGLLPVAGRGRGEAAALLERAGATPDSTTAEVVFASTTTTATASTLRAQRNEPTTMAKGRRRSAGASRRRGCGSGRSVTAAGCRSARQRRRGPWPPPPPSGRLPTFGTPSASRRRWRTAYGENVRSASIASTVASRARRVTGRAVEQKAMAAVRGERAVPVMTVVREW